jgi:hypothetical protein
MTYSEEQVEWIVAEVLRRLGLLSSNPGATAAPGPATTALAIADKVVTLRSIEGRLSGVQRLVVSRKAVVTPAVRDELKQRHIELVREGQS